MPYTAQDSAPHVLLDRIRAERDLKSDYRLAIELELNSPIVSKIRNRRSNISAEVILAIHEKIGMPVAKIRELIKQSQDQWEELQNGNKESDHSNSTSTAHVGAGEEVAS